MSRQLNTSLVAAATELLHNHFGPGPVTGSTFAPGRVNLIGEHVDYHKLPVLPIAIKRGVCVAYRARKDGQVSAVSGNSSEPVTIDFESVGGAEKRPGDWGNYLRAAILLAQTRFGISSGIDAAIVSDLPIAAGLSSSSALLIAFTLALLASDGIEPGLEELMEVLPEGEQFVGTRGGGMDHAAILASREACATYLQFDPFVVSHVPIPEDWCFVVADSLHAAEKSSGLVHEYNKRRDSGANALRTLGFASYQEALVADLAQCLRFLSNRDEQNAFVHVVGEARRVEEAVAAMKADDLRRFGELLNESHSSLRDRLLVSTPTIDALVETGLEASAAGARITGAGFGGCMVALCHQSLVDKLHDTLKLRHYAHLEPADVEHHLFIAEAASGALEVASG